MPQTSGRTSIWPGPGPGAGRSSILKPPFSKTAARMVALPVGATRPRSRGRADLTSELHSERGTDPARHLVHNLASPADGAQVERIDLLAGVEHVVDPQRQRPPAIGRPVAGEGVDARACR